MITNIIALLLALAVVVYASARSRALPESISDIAYIIPHWAFSVWIVAVGFALLPAMLDALPDEWRWVGFLSVAGLFCVASSAYYKTEAAALHYTGGCLCALCATAVVAMLCPKLLLLWAVYVAAMTFLRFDRWLFWAEVTVFVTLLAIPLFA